MEATYDEEFVEIELREYIFLVWKKKWFITVVTLVAILVSFIFNFYIITPVYQAQATIHLSNVEGMYSNLSTAMQILKSNDLVMPVFTELGEDYTDANLQDYLKNNMMILAKDESPRTVNISLNNANKLLVVRLLNGIILTYKEKADLQYNEIVNKKKAGFAKDIE